MAITSTCRVSELQALCTDAACYKFVHPEVLILRTNLSFMPKCKPEFHRAQEIVLRAFQPNPQTSNSRSLHKMCPVRALKYYRDRTKNIRKTDQLFISFGAGKEGHPLPKRWISTLLIKAIKLPIYTKAPPKATMLEHILLGLKLCLGWPQESILYVSVRQPLGPTCILYLHITGYNICGRCRAFLHRSLLGFRCRAFLHRSLLGFLTLPPHQYERD